MSPAPLTTGPLSAVPAPFTSTTPVAGPEGVGILLAMTIPLRTRVYVMTIAVLMGVVGSGACFGFSMANWAGALVGSVAAGTGAGFGMAIRPRPAMTSVGGPGATAMRKGSPTRSS